MLEGIVRHQKKYLLILAALLIMVWLLAPALQGVLSRLKAPRYAGEIFGEKISMDEFLGVRARMMLMAPSGTRLSPGHVWDRLLQLRMAEKLGIEASDQEVEEYIMDFIKRMYRQDALTEETYRSFLRGVQMTASQFEKTIRENLVLNKLRSYMSNAIKVTSEEIWHDYKRDNDAFEVRYIEVPFKNFVETIEQPSEEEIKLYWRENKEGFRVPEKIKVGYYAAQALDFEKRALVTDEMIKDYYETHKEQYRIERPPEEKDEPGTDEKDEKASKKEEPEYRPLKKVRAQIEKELRKEKANELAGDELYDLVTELEESGRDPEEVIKEYPEIRYEETDYFSRTGAPGLKDIGTSKSGNKTFAEIVFELEKGVISEIASNPNGHFAFRYLDRKESYIQELASVTDKIVEKLKDTKVNKKAWAKAREVLKKLKEEGASEEEVLKSEKGLKAVTTKKFYKRTDVPTPFPSGVLDFDLNAWDGPLPKGDAYYIAKTIEKKDASRIDFEKEKEKERRGGNLLWQKRISFTYMGQWQRDLEERADLVDYTEKLFGEGSR